MAEGKSTIRHPLLSRDTTATIEACEFLGASIAGNSDELVIHGFKTPKVPENIIDTQNSGSTIRMMTAVSALIPHGYTLLTGDKSIRRRPMQPLLDALNQLGVPCWSSRMDGCPPIIVQGGKYIGGRAEIRGDISSQFISAILLSAPKALNDTTLRVAGRIVSKPYLDATLRMIRHFGARVSNTGLGTYHTEGTQEYTRNDFDVPGDIGSASFIIAAALMTGGEIKIRGINLSLPQADSAMLDIVQEMGAEVTVNGKSLEITVKAKESIKGGMFDLSDSPDLLPIVAVLGLKADSEVTIRGVSHARFKETDRIAMLAKELSKLGCNIQELDDGLIVRPAKYDRARLDSHDDHRLFMAFTVAGLASGNHLIVDGAESADVSYPNFIEHIKSINGNVEEIQG